MSVSGPNISVATVAARSAKVDAVVIGVAPSDGGLALAPGSDDVDAALGGTLTQTLTRLGAKGKADEVTVLPSGGALVAPLVAAVGLGSEDPSPEALRRAAGAAVRALAGRADTVALALTDADPTTVGVLAEGALLGAYSYDRYRSDNGERPRPVSAVTVLTSHRRDKETKAALERAQTIARAVNLARDWVNTSPSDLYPAVFAEEARAAGKRAGLSVEILDEKALEAGGYGGILGVGKGSQRPPRLVRLSYRPSRATKHLAFVGKGITFDTGGISLKPSDAMITMKSDMSGAAAVIAAAAAVADLGLPVAVTAWAPMAENMPSGSAQRPSDVLRIYGGKTVEVLNTDAEGRLVLADAIVRAGEDKPKPDVIVDVATLTGACVVALGPRVFGIMANDDDLRAKVHQIAERVGEDGWPLPIPEGTRERLQSKVADLANVSTQRQGGALVAASFLEAFVADGIRWAHLDIAGPAFNESGPWGYTPAGGTGCGVRTLVGLAEAAAAGEL
ncbi:leucyl aminopeptidase [Thermasporomyces composti]|uniref:Probable cytosol aminopeptidase n=1 Tax=Thermasporomyces composti TaxID=696763 RepID=A0A3D9V9V4_THECX|nr:leucyl aminopeptidase [Thermasporomyces composti]REF34934.1 leucyl aminopeptidase [Thermasporomyces composti]